MEKKRLGAVVGVVGTAGVLAATQFLNIESSQAEHISKDLSARFNATLEEARNQQAAQSDEASQAKDAEAQAAELAERTQKSAVHYDVAQKVEYVVGDALDFEADPVAKAQRLAEVKVKSPAPVQKAPEHVVTPTTDVSVNEETEAPEQSEAPATEVVETPQPEEDQIVPEEAPTSDDVSADQELEEQETPEEARAFIGKVRPEALNVRSEASTEASILSVLAQDEVVRGTLEAGWVSFEDADGVTGYLKSEFLDELNESEAEAQEAENLARAEAEREAEEKAQAEKEAAEKAEAEAKAQAEKEAAEKKAAEEAAAQKAAEEAARKEAEEAAKKEAEEAAQRHGDPVSGYLQYVSNVRKGPGMGYDVVTTLDINTYIEGEEIDGWVRFTLDGDTVYVSGSLLDDDKVVYEEEEEEIDDEEDEESYSDGGREDVLAYAESKVGNAYVWGAQGPNAFDCSGLVVAAYRQAGISLPHSSASQFNCGYSVSLDNLQRGDLLFFDTSGGGGVSHVGIYVGDGQMIHASNPSTGVRYDSIYSRYYSTRFLGARRIFN